MPVKNYDTVDGRLVGDRDPGNSSTTYFFDPSGTMTGAFVDGVAEFSSFTPYGRGTEVAAFGWNGAWGYRPTGKAEASHYVRARSYSSARGRWTSQDPLWPEESAYGYAAGDPVGVVDSSGRSIGDWIPPYNESDGDSTYCKTRKPRPAGRELDDYLIWPCAVCLTFARVEPDSAFGGDKPSHFVAGCLARIRCGDVCPNSVGSYKEYSDSKTGGTVSQSDALATDDGWDYADNYIEGLPTFPGQEGKFQLNDIKFCQAGARRSIWWKYGSSVKPPRGKAKGRLTR